MTKKEELFGHPKGLFILFMVEMWERFSYYGMRALLILYLTAPLIGVNTGLGWDNDRALGFYGWYTMLVYLSSIPGGVIADKFIGQKNAVILGGAMLVLGHSILAINAQWAFFTGLAFIVLGVGGLKANISSMVGGLYQPGDERRDKGFYIFYIGINIGAFVGSIGTGILAVEKGWHWGFGAAGVGMLIGQIILMLGRKHLSGVGEFQESKSNEANTSLGQLFGMLLKSPKQLGITIVLSLVSILLALNFADGGEQIAYSLLGLFLCVTFGLLTMIYRDITLEEKDRFLVLLLAFLISIIFWGAFEQAGGLMNLYTEQKTNRDIDLLNFEVPTAWFQSINAFYIIVLGTAVASLWTWWARQGREASSIFKLAVGVIIMGLGFVFMSAASIEYTNTGKSAMIWLVLAYLFHTIGELCASPVALSFVTKVAPVRYVSIMMGVYFAALGLGSKVAGLVGQLSQRAGELETFTGLVIFCVLFGLLIIAFVKRLKRMTHGAEEVIS